MKTPAFAPVFGHFRGPVTNVRPDAHPLTLRQLFALLTGPTLAAQTAAIRSAAPDSPGRGRLKTGLPYFTGAGVFVPTRADENLTRFSGCILLDFDNLADVGAARAALLADKHLAPALLLLFTSPGGNGLKALLRAAPAPLGGYPNGSPEGLPAADARRLLAANFDTLAAYLTARHGLTPDRAAAALSQPCYLCHAPDAWLNPTI